MASQAITVSKQRDERAAVYITTKRQKFVIKLLAFILAVLFTFPVFAADNVSASGALALRMFDTISGYDEESNSLKTGEDLEDIINVNFDNGENTKIGDYDVSILTGENGIINGVNQACFGVALALCIAMFCVSWLQAYFNGTVSDEVWLQKFAIFGMSIIGIFVARRLALAIATVGSGVAGAVINSVANSGNVKDSVTGTVVDKVAELRQTIKTNTAVPDGALSMAAHMDQTLQGFATGIAYMASLALPWLVAWIAKAVVYLNAIARAIEVLIIAAFAPFGMLGIERGLDGPIRFAKQMFVLGLQGAIIITVVIVSQQLTVSALGSTLWDNGITAGNLWGVVAINLAEIGMISRSRSIAQTIAG